MQRNGTARRRAARWRLRHGDCLDHLPRLRPNSVDAIVTDPPYGLEFMGKDWDRLVAAPRGARAGTEHAPTLEHRDDSPHHRAAVKQPAMQMRCAKCGGNSTGQWGRCSCVQPQFRPQLGPTRAMQEWHEAWAREALRVLKPGGHLVAFGGTRTHHRLVCAVEDAGFEIRDCIVWLYGSGFPKSLNVSKAIDKAAEAERQVMRRGRTRSGETRSLKLRNTQPGYGANGDSDGQNVFEVAAPAAREAARWDGWGTALKPAFEPIVVARKPLVGTVAANVLKYGTGAINVDACRIELGEAADYVANPSGDRTHDTNLRAGVGRPKRVARGRDTPGKNTYGSNGPGGGSFADGSTMLGRWPANVVLDPAAAAALDEQTQVLVSGTNPTRRNSDDSRAGYSESVDGEDYDPAARADVRGASRFYYCAKASRGERNAGLSEPQGGSASRLLVNNHPTVKPIRLLRWIVRLVTPPEGIVLDVFTGSGTTGCAAVLEGFGFIGIERDASYVDIARRRIRYWADQSSR
jgi:DNA modification methylase